LASVPFFGWIFGRLCNSGYTAAYTSPYLELIGEAVLPQSLFDVIDIADSFPIERVNRLLNSVTEEPQRRLRSSGASAEAGGHE